MTDGTRAVESLEIGPETRDRVAEIARRHRVRFLVAFGSQVRVILTITIPLT